MKTISLLLFTLLSTSVLVYLNYNRSSSANQSLQHFFQSWKNQHGITYPTKSQDQLRLQIFTKNYMEIQAFNKDLNNTYRKSINQFSALTQQEFKSIYLGYISNYQKGNNKDNQQPKSEETNIYPVQSLKEQIDWVSQGYVTAIKNQGQCGSCWAFSSTGGLEGLYMKQKGSLKSFSEQQLVDCTHLIGNLGCQGGNMGPTFAYTRINGITSEEAYPYTAKNGICKPFTKDFSNSGGHKTILGSCPVLLSALSLQPISVSVDAVKWSSYSSGIFNTCGLHLDHGVLLVGVNNDNSSSSYWKVKNSWGKNWGENGFIRLAMGNTCGICQEASYPI